MLTQFKHLWPPTSAGSANVPEPARSRSSNGLSIDMLGFIRGIKALIVRLEGLKLQPGYATSSILAVVNSRMAA